MVESHDAGMNKNEDAYRMLSKMQKGAYEEESIALAEIFVKMKANQTKKEAKQAEKEAKRTQKEASKKKPHGKKRSRQRPQIKLMLRFWGNY